MAHIGYVFVPPNKPCNPPSTMGNAQEQALRTKRFSKINTCSEDTSLWTELKKQIVTDVHPFFLYPLLDQLASFRQVTALQMLQHIFNSYGAIDKIDLKKNTEKMMGTYDPAETLA